MRTSRAVRVVAVRVVAVTVAAAAPLLALVPQATSAAAPAPGTTLVTTPVDPPLPPGDATPQAAVAAGTGDGSSVVYFAGNEAETWVWSSAGRTWSRRSPADAPSERQGAAGGPLAGGGDRALLYGGYEADGDEYFDETWMFDVGSDTWTKRCGPCAPGPLTRAMIAASPTETLLVGGNNGFGFDYDVWRWDDQASDWVPVVPDDSGGSPPGRGDGQLAFDGTDFVLYGGLNGSFVAMDDTWLLIDEGGGSYRWELVCEHCPPGARALAGFAQIGGAGTPAGALLFGGENFDSHSPTTPVLSDGWFWDAAAHSWTKVIAGVAPSTTPLDPAVPYSPTLASFGAAGAAQQVLLTDTRFDAAGSASTESNTLAWQLPTPPPTTTTTSTTAPSSTTTAPPSANPAANPAATPAPTPVVVAPRFAG